MTERSIVTLDTQSGSRFLTSVVKERQGICSIVMYMLIINGHFERWEDRHQFIIVHLRT